MPFRVPSRRSGCRSQPRIPGLFGVGRHIHLQQQIAQLQEGAQLWAGQGQVRAGYKLMKQAWAWAQLQRWAGRADKHRCDRAAHIAAHKQVQHNVCEGARLMPQSAHA